MGTALYGPDLVRGTSVDQFESHPINQHFTPMSSYRFNRKDIFPDDPDDSSERDVDIYIGNYRRGMGNDHHGLGIMINDGNRASVRVFDLFSTENTDWGLFTADNLFINPVTDLDAEWEDFDGDGDLDLIVAYLTHGDQGPDRLGVLFFLNCNGRFKRMNTDFTSNSAGTIANARCYGGLCRLDTNLSSPQFKNLELFPYAPEESWGNNDPSRHYRVSYDAFHYNPTTDQDVDIGRHSLSWELDNRGEFVEGSRKFNGPSVEEMAALYTTYVESKYLDDGSVAEIEK